MVQRTYTFSISNAVEIWYVPHFKPFGIFTDIHFSTYRVIRMITITAHTIPRRLPMVAGGTNPIMQRINYTGYLRLRALVSTLSGYLTVRGLPLYIPYAFFLSQIIPSLPLLHHVRNLENSTHLNTSALLGFVFK